MLVFCIPWYLRPIVLWRFPKPWNVIHKILLKCYSAVKLCWAQVWRATYRRDIQLLTRTLLGLVNGSFPIEFIKAFSKLSVCYQQNLCIYLLLLLLLLLLSMFFSITQLFGLFTKQNLISSVFKNLHCLCCFLFLAFFLLLCFLYIK